MTGETGDREACEKRKRMTCDTGDHDAGVKKKKSATFETGGRAADVSTGGALQSQVINCRKLLLQIMLKIFSTGGGCCDACVVTMSCLVFVCDSLVGWWIRDRRNR